MTQWEKYIQIDRSWVSQELKDQFIIKEHKISIRVYTVRFSGTSCSTSSLIDELLLMIKHFVLSPKQIEELGSDRALLHAFKYFGHKDPVTDGKYGELLLFALVESVLGCKMIAHKIRSLSNYRDQVKGGDGIFLGNYEVAKGSFSPAYLIGESKIMNQRSESITDGLESLNRFHDMINSPGFSDTEFMVAKDNLVIDPEIDLDEVYDRLTPSTQVFKDQILIHPVLLVFNTARISAIEQRALTNSEAEAMLANYARSQKDKILRYINNVLKDYPEIKKVQLEFFLLPIKDVNDFRHSFYFKIHNAPYR